MYRASISAWRQNPLNIAISYSNSSAYWYSIHTYISITQIINGNLTEFPHKNYDYYCAACFHNRLKMNRKKTLCKR